MHSWHIHDWNPILLPLYGPLAVRWYGIAYLLGFLAGYWLWAYLARRKLFPVPVEDLPNFTLGLAFFGVFLGGRAGYVLFYGLKYWQADWLYPLKIWEGGMASHGGTLGVILFCLWYARQHRFSFLELTDGGACVAPIGLFFGRLANFINGELWGRVADVPWAMIFPSEGGFGHGVLTHPQVMELVQSGRLHPRHPSQLYEAAGEGLILFAAIWFLRFRPVSRTPGFLSAMYLFIYGFARIGAEFFREPDSAVWFGWLTRGQALSFLMIGVGIILLGVVRHKSRQCPA